MLLPEAIKCLDKNEIIVLIIIVVVVNMLIYFVLPVTSSSLSLVMKDRKSSCTSSCAFGVHSGNSSVIL